MAMRQKGKTVHRSMRGKTVDMDLLRQRNELTPAVGNVRVNARGDELGAGGQIVRKREQVLKEYYENSPRMTKETTKEEILAPTTEEILAPSKAEQLLSQEQDDWVEDEDGNFVKKGE